MIRRLRIMLVLGAVVLFVATLSGCQPSQSPTKTIVLYGFSITENVLKVEIEPDAELPKDKYRLTSTENNNAYYGDTTFIVKSMKSRIYREAQQDMIDNGWVIRKVGG